MDDAVLARDAAVEAIADIEPARLRTTLHDRIRGASVTPGVLTLATARAHVSETNWDAVADQAAGVQLIYEGLRLTRRLAHEEPWAFDDTDGNGDRDGDIPADMEILAADVLVSRGFYLLAHTDAATAAVDVVRSFGRDQTLGRRSGQDAGSLDRNLEADALELAVVVGTTAVDRKPTPELVASARELVGDDEDTEEGFGPPGSVLADLLDGGIETLIRSSPDR